MVMDDNGYVLLIASYLYSEGHKYIFTVYTTQHGFGGVPQD